MVGDPFPPSPPPNTRPPTPAIAERFTQLHNLRATTAAGATLPGTGGAATGGAVPGMPPGPGPAPAIARLITLVHVGAGVAAGMATTRLSLVEQAGVAAHLGPASQFAAPAFAKAGIGMGTAQAGDYPGYGGGPGVYGAGVNQSGMPVVAQRTQAQI